MFGERPDYYSQFYVRDWDGQMKPLVGHEGTDWGLPIGSLVFSCLSGKITLLSSTGPYGKHLVITSGQFTITYAHLSEFLVQLGDEVAEGQTISKSGNSGNSTGPHLHVSVKLAGASKAGLTSQPADLVDPMTYLKQDSQDIPNIYVTATPYLNVRAGKATNYPVIGTLAYNSLVTLVEPETDLIKIGIDGQWVKVEVRAGVTGYCSAVYLRKEAPTIKRAIGFDFSHHQGTLVTEQQWKDSGAAFLIARASYSFQGSAGMSLDGSYPDHIASARSAKMLVGAYHYLTKFNTGVDQARFFVNAANRVEALELPFWADVEDEGLTETIVRDFCEEVDRLTGRVTGIYTRRSFWEPYIGHRLAWAKDRPLWIAQYPNSYADSSVPSGLPDTWDTWEIWQYAVKRPVFYPKEVDHNVYNGTNETIWQRYGVKELTLAERVQLLEMRVGALEERLDSV